MVTDVDFKDVFLLLYLKSDVFTFGGFLLLLRRRVVTGVALCLLFVISVII